MLIVFYTPSTAARALEKISAPLLAGLQLPGKKLPGKNNNVKKMCWIAKCMSRTNKCRVKRNQPGQSQHCRPRETMEECHHRSDLWWRHQHTHVDCFFTPSMAAHALEKISAPLLAGLQLPGKKLPGKNNNVKKNVLDCEMHVMDK